MAVAVKFRKSLLAWPAGNFQEVVKQEIEQLDWENLPLQQGLTQGSYVTEEPIKVIIIKDDEQEKSIRVKAGIYYSSTIAGCSCADDPTPIDCCQEYCEILLDIDKKTASIAVELVVDS